MRFVRAFVHAVGPFLLGSFGIIAWNVVIGWAADALGIGPPQRPEPSSLTPGDFAFLMVRITLAGVVGAALCTRVAAKRPDIHMWVFFALWLLNDILVFTIGPAAPFPLWYRVSMVALVPPQLYVGYRLGLAWRGER